MQDNFTPAASIEKLLGTFVIELLQDFYAVFNVITYLAHGIVSAVASSRKSIQILH